MKKSLPAIAALMLLTVACASLYTGVVTVTTVVDAAMKSWAELSVKGQTSSAIDAKVIVAHDKYRAACGIAQTALIAYKQSGDPAQYNAAIQSARDAANALLDLIIPLLSPQQGSELKTQLSNAKSL